MTPTMAAAPSRAATICLATRSLPARLATRMNNDDATASRAATRSALPRNSGAANAATNAHATIAANGIVIGVRHPNEDGDLSQALAPSKSAASIATSTVVRVKPAIEPGTARSKGETPATSITLAGSAQEPARVRASDTRGIEITATSAKSGRRSAIHRPVLPGTVGAFAPGVGRKLTVRGRAADQGFPNVKLLSRFVMHGVSARIALKGAADIAGKAVTLVITAVAARTLVADAFGVM